uniref:Uncharacterized protein n=1 Tax=Arundo donax TaxID=35708 RepID=A0A0A9HD08_ARUDO
MLLGIGAASAASLYRFLPASPTSIDLTNLGISGAPPLLYPAGSPLPCHHWSLPPAHRRVLRIQLLSAHCISSSSTRAPHLPPCRTP